MKIKKYKPANIEEAKEVQHVLIRFPLTSYTPKKGMNQNRYAWFLLLRQRIFKYNMFVCGVFGR